MKKKVLRAFCPQCECYHWVYLKGDAGTTVRWTGNGIPRMFCEKCKVRHRRFNITNEVCDRLA
jgi:hypothetical protein